MIRKIVNNKILIINSRREKDNRPRKMEKVEGHDVILKYKLLYCF
jgi:hypothetical protein